jgi:uncharacterized surface protein with fasciclin (FAS1) repeats
MAGFFSCERTAPDPGFDDLEKSSILDYVKKDSAFTSFYKILRSAGIDITLNAYNPNGLGYSLFLPDNEAVQEFIESNGQYNSLEDLLKDQGFVKVLARYHVINQGLHTNNFPFGAFSEFTLSDDLLTVKYSKSVSDSLQYKINGEAAVIGPNIEVSNGFVHVIEKMLLPITFTTYDWLGKTEDFSIFKTAVEHTGFLSQLTIDVNSGLGNISLRPVTLLVEPDSVYHKYGIGSFEDLVQLISPDRNDYTEPENPLNIFVGYHILNESIFLDEFDGISSNYATKADIPLNVNGMGVELLINKGKEIFDTLIVGPDTAIIDYIGFYYDQGNIVTRSGAVHLIDNVMRQQRPTRASQYFQFSEEPLFEELGRNVGTFFVQDPAELVNLSFSGSDLYYVKQALSESVTWNADYIAIEGDFEIEYRLPKIVEGKYKVILGAHSLSQDNALVEVFIDGKKVGGLINLTKGGYQSWPFIDTQVGNVNFTRYEAHTVVIKSLVPGVFLWDRIGFEPI